MSGALLRGREAIRRQAWGDAHLQLTAADRAGELDASDLEGAALAAYLTGRDGESQGLWTRAHRGWLSRGERCRAARCAFWIGLPLLLQGEAARGGGWLARGSRLLQGRGMDCAERGLLLVPAGLQALRDGDPAGALETFGRAEELGERSGDGSGRGVDGGADPLVRLPAGPRAFPRRVSRSSRGGHAASRPVARGAGGSDACLLLARRARRRGPRSLPAG